MRILLNRLGLCFLTGSLILIPLQARAGAFRVVPTKITLETQAKTATVKVINTSDEKVTIQVEGMTWQQDAEGRDEYEATKELVFFPKIFSMAANEERIVRVGYQEAWPLREKTYRLYLQELPTSKPGETALKMVLRLGIPVFIQPVKATQAHTVEIERVTLSGAQLLVQVKNTGNSHVLVRTIKASGLDSSGAEVFSQETAGWYVLTGVSKPFLLTISTEQCRQAKAIQVAVEGGQSNLETTLQIEKAQCTQHLEGSHKPVQEGKR
jgi:fimbrial chaperone protein